MGTFQLNFERDGYYVVRPDCEGPAHIEWHDLDTSMQFEGKQGLYEIIGNGCDIVQGVQLAERGFEHHKDPSTIFGVRFEPQGKMVEAWVDEEGMYRQVPNVVARFIVDQLGYIDTSHGIWGTMVICCGKSAVE